LGRQVSFYAGPRDIDELTQELRKKGSVIIAERSPGPEPMVADSALPMLEGSICAWLVREEDLSRVEWGHYPNLGYWLLDQMASPAVQYWGPRVKDHVMSTGRLWFSPEGSVLRKKPEDFIRWADSLLRVTRKLFSRLPKPEGYSYTHHIGPDAEEMVSSGQIVLDDANFMSRVNLKKP
jgi:hypothetical protein